MTFAIRKRSRGSALHDVNLELPFHAPVRFPLGHHNI